MGNVWHEKAECLIKQKILNKAKILLFFLIILQKNLKIMECTYGGS